MRKLVLAAVVATTFLVPQVFAQSKNFEGFSAGLSANFNSMKTEIPGQSPSESSTTAGIKAAYGWALSNQFILSLAASYDMGNIKAGTTASGATATAKGLAVVSIEPGFKASNDTLVYARLGYATVKGELEGAVTGSNNYDGTAVGIGVRSMMNKNWSIDLEAQQFTFTAKNLTAAGGDVKPSGTVLSIGVNYHF